MHRAVLTACLPWLAALAASVLFAGFLLRLSRARLQLGRLRQLHREQSGGVQSLSFVLTLPIFIMVMMLIVQISQVMVGIMVVHYAAFAAAQSAIVWIPADLSRIDANLLRPAERSNCISIYLPDPENQAFPQNPLWTQITNSRGEDLGGHYVSPDGTGPEDGGVTYLVAPDGPKYQKIFSAAVLALMPISPSRDMGYALEDSPALLGANAPPGYTSAVDAENILQAAYMAMSPGAADIPAVPRRLRNKLAYALQNTTLELRFYHQNSEPPLQPYPMLFGPEDTLSGNVEFLANELGRQDLVTVKITHHFAMLPGPGRLLARYGLFGEEVHREAEKAALKKSAFTKTPSAFRLRLPPP